MVKLDLTKNIWEHFFTVAPLVLIGTREGEEYNLAPKHMATPLGQGNYFGFVCTPRHATYHNVKAQRGFTVSFPSPGQVLLASLAASVRREGCALPKPVLAGLPTLRGEHVDALFLEDSYLMLECELDRIVDGFGDYSLIAGRIVEARVKEASLRTSDKDEQQMVFDNPMLAFLAYGRFAEIRETLAFPYPKEFKD